MHSYKLKTETQQWTNMEVEGHFEKMALSTVHQVRTGSRDTGSTTESRTVNQEVFLPGML